MIASSGKADCAVGEDVDDDAGAHSPPLRQHQEFVGANTLSGTLWELRKLLGQLLARLEDDHQALTSGQSRWLPERNRKLQKLTALLRETEFRRVIEVGRFADDQATLAELALRIPSGSWDLIFTAHRTAMGELLGQVCGRRETNSGLLRRSLPADPDGAGGSTVPDGTAAVEAALALYARSVPATLVDFLR